MKLDGRRAVITGASRGLGREIAKQYVKQGASVLLCARDMSVLQRTANELEKYKVSDSQEILVFKADVGKEAEIDKLVSKAATAFDHQIDILINNAGVYGPLGRIEEIDWQDWIESININLMGLIYLCKEIIPLMKRRRQGKIINVSGGGATAPLARLTAYAVAKAAVVRFTESIALDLIAYGIDVNAIAPGALKTDLNTKLLATDPEVVGRDFHAALSEKLANGGTPLKLGAALSVYLGSKDSDGISGKLISAPWDPWAQLHLHKEVLMNSDIYALRRIVPSDRDVEWE